MTLAMFGIPLVDLVALAAFCAAWIGYALWADRGDRRTLMARTHEYRRVWMTRMMARDNRIVDTQIITLLVQNISFFASTAILVVGGLMAVLGARDQAMAILSEIPWAADTPPRLWEVKILLLVIVFVYAFFKFTWALRQFNYVAIMIGAAPPPETAGTSEAVRLVERIARMATRAAEHFNKAMRAFYFGLAALSWFLHPWAFLVATAWVLVVNWRREFRSRSLELLGSVGDPIDGTS